MNAVLAAAAVAVAAAAAFQLYRVRELPVRGRMLFASLRAATAALVVVLFVNPDLPSGGSSAGPALVIDASRSMSAGSTGETPEVRAEAELEGFPEAVALAPTDLAGAVASAVEGGADRVVVVTDLRAPDGVALRAVAAESPVPIEVRDVGGELSNAGVSAFELPERGRPGSEIEAVVRLHATSTDPVEVFVAIGADTLARATAIPGAPGTERSVPLRFGLPETNDEAPPVLVLRAGVVRSGDTFDADDTRLGVVALDDPAGGIVAVSWTPDWEFRSLLPLLDEVAGLPVTGFFALGEGRWLRASGAPGVVESTDVRSALARAEMALLHAPPAEDPSGVLATAARVPRRLVLAARGPFELAGEPLGPVQPGEWFVAADLPASPIAADLAGLELLGLPPLHATRLGAASGPSPLELQRGGSGAPVPAFDLVAEEGERIAVARAEGFWRWAQRDGAPRELYRRLWSGITGWLLEPDATTRAAGFGPDVDAALPSTTIPVVGAPSSRIALEWRRADAGDAADGGSSDDAVVRVDTVTLAADGRGAAEGFDTAGAYRWTASAVEPETPEGDSATAAVTLGTVVVQPGGDEFRPARDLALPDDVASLAADRRPRSAGGTPLREHPGPWIALVLLLSAEWIGRRRSGLR